MSRDLYRYPIVLIGFTFLQSIQGHKENQVFSCKVKGIFLFLSHFCVRI